MTGSALSAVLKENNEEFGRRERFGKDLHTVYIAHLIQSASRGRMRPRSDLG
jgi:hypothetical protein